MNNKKNENIDDIDEDYILIRDELRSLVKKGRSAIESCENIVEETAHPRAIDALAGLLKQQSDIVSKLMTLQKDKKIVRQKFITNGKEDGPSIGQFQSNTIHVGTVAELQKMLKDDSNILEGDINATK